jgi:mannosyltransferase
MRTTTVGRALTSDTVLVTAGILASTVLSFWQIGHKSFWTDEGSSVFFAQDWSNMWQQLLHRESNMWLYYILLHFWLKLGDSEAFLRAPSAVFTVATVLALYGIGRRLVSRRAGAICALLAATNYFLIRYAQEARGYALAVCLATVSTYLFLLAVERRTPAFWLGYAVCAAAGIYTHFFAALVCLAQYACLPLLGRRNIPWVGATVGLAALASLLLPLVLFEPFRNQIPWVAPPSLYSVVEFCRVAAGSWPLLFLHLGFGLGALRVVLYRPRRDKYPPAFWCHVLAAAWAGLPVLVTFVFSRTVRPIFAHRFLVVMVPGLVLFGALGIARLRRTWMQAVVVAVMLFLSARCLHWWYTVQRKENWRAATAWVQSHAQPGDAVGFYWWTGKDPFWYYLQRAPATVPLVLLDFAIQSERKEDPLFRLDTQLIENLRLKYERVWFVVRTGLDHPQTVSILRILQPHYRQVAHKDFTGIHLLLLQRAGPGPRALTESPAVPGPAPARVVP